MAWCWNRRQAYIWSHDDLDYWRIHVVRPHCVNVLFQQIWLAKCYPQFGISFLPNQYRCMPQCIKTFSNCMDVRNWLVRRSCFHKSLKFKIRQTVGNKQFGVALKYLHKCCFLTHTVLWLDDFDVSSIRTMYLLTRLVDVVHLHTFLICIRDLVGIPPVDLLAPSEKDKDWSRWSWSRGKHGLER